MGKPGVGTRGPSGSGAALRVPPELSARVPAEQRGAGRDAVRLLVGRRGGGEVSHHVFADLPSLLRAGDVLVVNTSKTLPAAVDGTVEGVPVVVHFSTRQDDGRWAVELRRPDGRGSTLPRPGGPAGALVELAGGGRLVIVRPLSPRGDRLWVAAASMPDVVAHLYRHGRPIRYGYTERDQPLSAYGTVFEAPSPDGLGSAEMPSAARPFTPAMVTELVSRGVHVAPVTLHTGVASAEAHEPPFPERFRVPASTALLVNAVRRAGAGGWGRPVGRGGGAGPAGGGRVVAVGTTAVRALESAAGPDGLLTAADGWTDLVITPERGVRVVDGLLTGLHEPEASHLLMLEAVAGPRLLAEVYGQAVERGYLWHEFGDSTLLLPWEAGTNQTNPPQIVDGERRGDHAQCPGL
ncbi:S-adenosylmethionine:tRNA ribosyltransferase-isomerase [Wenjunlia tyrosinilytica]|uniref:S-adenosylmethionine:tRNA ribosyltransferase-isomerase n=1 Tax=Wenjunlia tyrosinilytica TaxID=1544741 RepID=UPI003571730D